MVRLGNPDAPLLLHVVIQDAADNQQVKQHGQLAPTNANTCPRFAPRLMLAVAVTESRHEGVLLPTSIGSNERHSHSGLVHNETTTLGRCHRRVSAPARDCYHFLIAEGFSDCKTGACTM